MYDRWQVNDKNKLYVELQNVYENLIIKLRIYYIYANQIYLFTNYKMNVRKCIKHYKYFNL